MNAYFDDSNMEIAEAEDWLSRFPTPSPSGEALAAARQAVHAELARRDKVRPARLKTWHGAIGAAATMAACVAFAWFGAAKFESTRLVAGPVDVAVPAALASESTELAELEEGLTDLEALSPALLEPAGLSLYEAWEASLDGGSDSEGDDVGASTGRRSGRNSTGPRFG